MHEFGEFAFDSAGDGLTRHGVAVPLEPQAIRLLEFLITHADRVIPKEELVNEIWDGRAITDAALNTRIRAVRKALGDDGTRQEYIKTYPKRGFQFVADLRDVPASRQTRDKAALPAIIAIGVAAIAMILILFLFVWRDSALSPALEDKPSIAVLPFENLGGNEGGQYFVDGLTDDLTARLSRYRELFVISRSTVFAYGNAALTPVEVARDLGVSFAARGSVRRDGNQVRVTSELVDVNLGKTIWAESFDRNLTGIFEVQDEISQAIAGQLVPEIIQAGSHSTSNQPTEDMGAWDLYLRARAQQATFSKAAQSRAAKLARLAIARDNQFAAAHSLLARALGTQFFFRWSDNPAQTLAKATAAAKRAIALDSNDAQAHAALGYIQRFAGQADPAIANLERAVELNPNDAQIRLEFAHTLDWFRLQERALPQINLAIRLSPRDPLLQNMYFYKGHILFHLGRFEESLEAARLMGAVATSRTWQVYHHLLRAANLAELKKMDDAHAAIAAALALNPNLSLAAMRRQFEGSNNHPENRRAWLESLKNAGLPK